MYISLPVLFLTLVGALLGYVIVKGRDGRNAEERRRALDIQEAKRSDRQERAGRAIRLKQFYPDAYAECLKLFSPKDLAEHLALLPPGKYNECLDSLFPSKLAYRPEAFATHLNSIVQPPATHT